MNFVKMGKHEINICLWELINKREDNDTWECFKRLKRPKSMIISFYKKTCKINNLPIEDEVIQKISSFLNDVVPPTLAIGEQSTTIIDEQEIKVTEAEPKMISRKRGN